MPFETQAIALTLTPGIPATPNEVLFEMVLEGVDVPQPVEPSRMFDSWTWVFNMSDDDWQDFVVPVIAPRIEQLCKDGWIEYGAWG